MNATSFCPNGLLCAVTVLSSHSLELRLQCRDTSATMTQAIVTEFVHIVATQ